MRPIPALAAALLLFLAACGGGGGRLDTAQVAFRAGNLDGAMALLEGDDTQAATALRERIAERRAARQELDARLEALAEADPDQALVQLEELEREVRDPIARERIERARSKAYDRRASQPVSRGRNGGDAPAPAPRQPTRPTRSEVSTADAMLAGLRAQVGKYMQTGEWARGLASLDMALDGAGERSADVHVLRRELLALAEVDLEVMLHETVAIEDERGIEAARAHLEREAARFPSTGPFEQIARELRDLEGRTEILRLADAPDEPGHGSAPSEPRPEPTAGGEPLERATAAERAGELRRAADLLLEHATTLPPSDERDAAVYRARQLERRALLREELVAARERRPDAFAALGIEDTDAGRLVVEGRRAEWGGIELELLARAARAASLSQEAELGLVLERLARGALEGADGALAELHRLAESGRMADDEVWQLVAQARREPVPEGGYVYRDGVWVSRGAHLDAERAALVAAREEELREADADERDTAFEALAGMGDVAAAALARALEARWSAAREKLERGGTLGQLERIAEERAELDRRREAALELIFDEVRYFYPYNPPAVDPDKAKDYWPVQQEVDGLVAAVREVWDRGRPVRPPASFRAALDELAWSAARALEASAPLRAEDELPDWVAGLDPELEQIALADFAWTARERADLAHDRAVRARNEELWEERERPTEQLANVSEAEQVRITNDYRRLMGRRALAWNPSIQEAARMHSNYMADTGDFGHFEPDPERRAPGDRMRLAGYFYGISENCHRGSGGPRGAHDGWTHSSGHHRNLLNPGHREMASAVASSYWTQNFGVGTDFLADLDQHPDAR